MPPTVITPLLTPVGALASPAGAPPDDADPALPPVVPPPLLTLWPWVPAVPAEPELLEPAAPGVARGAPPLSVLPADCVVAAWTFPDALLAVSVAEEFRPSSY